MGRRVAVSESDHDATADQTVAGAAKGVVGDALADTIDADGAGVTHQAVQPQPAGDIAVAVGRLCDH